MNKTKILIVEDEGLVAEDLANKLGQLGYEVAGIAAAGQDAIALASRLRPQLVLMDIVLEGPMDGIEAADAIRREHDVPVVYLTAHSDPGTLARAKLTGPFGYVLKPFDERDLATQIEMAIYRHQADQQLRQQREWLRVTLASIGDAVIATDAQARITFVNPVAEALTGWKGEEAAGQPVQSIFRIVNEQTGQPLAEPIASVLHERRAVELANHAALLTRDGRKVPIEDSAAPIFDAAHQVIGAVLVFHDVTEKRRVEERTKRQNAILQGINRVFQEALTCQTEEELGRTCLAVAEEITASKFSFVGEVGADSLLHDIAISDPGWEACQMTDPTGHRRPPGNFVIHGIYGRVLTHGKPVLTNDPGSHPDRIGLPAGHPPLTAFLGVPLVRGNETIGMIAVGNREGGYSDHDVQSLEALAPAIVEALDRKRAEEALRESRSKLEAAFGSMTEAIFIADAQGRLTDFNDEFVRYHRFTDRQECSRTIADCPKYLEACFADGTPAPVEMWAMPRALRGETAPNVEYMLRRKDTGETWWGSYSFGPIRDKDGRIVGAVVAAREITERKRVEARLAADLAALTQMHALSGRLWEPGGLQPLLQEVMDVAVAIVGAERGTLQLLEGDSLRIVAHHGHRQPFLDFFAAAENRASVCGEALQRGERVVVSDVETSSLFAGTPSLPVLREGGVRAVQSTPMVSRSGALLGILTTHWAAPYTPDEHDLWRLDLLTRQAADLIEYVKAKAAAETANAAKSQFLANMSHELRTPMNAILGMIDVALPKTADPTVQDCLQTAKGSADLLLTLLNDLLDSAKIESGKLELESAPFSLRRMLDQITRVLSVRASEKGLCFYCRMPDETPDAVMGDRTRLQQVLLNLAGNAIKFTERGDVEIGLHASSEDGEAGLEFAVRDTGIGIPPSGLERLFQPFSQADPSMTRRFGGTGLGLSISKNLAEMMGGRIWAESEVGKGSTFHFAVRLPLAKELPADFDAPVAVPTAACGQLRVLLVEDNPANQKLATYILQDRGHVVEIAGDGQESLCLTEQNRYDVILMDVQMPGMNGLEATAAIRKRENSGSRVPIIAMTAHAMRGDRDRCLAAGMNGYLSKPVNAQEMIGLVESLASGASPVGHFAAAAPGPAEASPLATGIVFDPEEALGRCFNSQDMVREMIRCYCDEVGNLFPQMRAALERGDLMEVGRLGHRMKGTVVYLGAQPAKEAALRVERFCKSSGGTTSEAEEAVNALEHECIALKAALIGHPLATEPMRDDSR